MLQEVKKKGTQVHIELGYNLKNESELILKEMGLSVSEAIRIFLRQVILTRQIPFDVRYSADIPNQKTIEAIKEIEVGLSKKMNLNELKALWDES